MIDTLRRKSYSLNAHLNDWRYGIHTGGSITPEELGTGRDARGYAPTPYPILRRLFRHVPLRLRQGTFIDFGCGKGRALAVASKHFASAIGIELAPRVADAARQNVARYSNVAVLTGSAVDYSIPRDATVFFFFNPFRGEVAQQVCANISALMQDGRERMLLTVNGQHITAELPCFRTLASGIAYPDNADWAVSVSH